MLYRQPLIREMLALAEMRGRMLFELRPDLFGPMLGPLEMELWSMFYEERQARRGRS